MAAVPAVDWQRVRGVVFDLDGTLYDHGPLRRRMAAELLRRCLRPGGLRAVRLLHSFRRAREELAEQEATGISRRQYEEPARRLGLTAPRVEAVVREWMFERPLRHLAPTRRPGAAELFAALRAGGRRVGVLSDYPAAAKLEALGLACDAAVSAVDPEVDRLKPHPAGLARLLARLELAPAETLVVGDRDERDGECARRLGCPYLILSRRPTTEHEFASFPDLLSSLAAS